MKIGELRTTRTQDKKDKIRLATELQMEADRLREQGTLESLRKAIEKYQEILTLVRDLHARNEEPYVLFWIGLCHGSAAERVTEARGQLNEFQEALDYSTQALSMFRALRNREGEAAALQNTALAYGGLGDMRKSIDFASQALALFRSIGNRPTNEREGNLLATIYSAYDLLGDTRKSIDFASQAVSLYRSIGNRAREAAALTKIGGVYNQIGENQKALDFFEQALLLWREVGCPAGQCGTGFSLGEGGTLLAIGAVYSSLGDKQKALDYGLRALQLQRAAGDRQGEAYTLTFVGNIYLFWDEKQKALDYYNQALPLSRAVLDRQGEAETLMNIGNCYSALGENQKALGVLNQALEIKRAVGEKRGEALTLAILGEVYYALGDNEKAFELGNQALQLFRIMGLSNYQAYAHFFFAQAWRKRGNLVEARNHIEKALSLAESLRAKIVSQELRSSYFGSVQEYYEFYIDLLMQLHNQRSSEGLNAVALQTSERARARSLLELLSEAHADIRQGVDPKIAERERSLQEQLNAKAEQQMKILAGPHSEEQASKIAREIDALTTELLQVETQIRQTSPHYAALTQPQPLTLKEIQTRVLDADTLLLEYSLGKDRSYLWAVTPDSMTSYELPKRDEIEQVARQVYDLLTHSEQWDEAQRQLVRSQQSQTTSSPEVTTRLSQMILAPVASQLGKKRLLVVGDGALQYIPFGALPIPTGSGAGGQRSVNTYSPLITEHEIVSLPSASTLAVLRGEANDRKPAPKAFAVLADPVFERTDERITTSTKKASKSLTDENRGLGIEVLKSAKDSGVRGDMRIPRLPGTRQEAEQILALVSPSERKQAFDFEANRATATGPDLSQYRYVHFATHGFLNSQNPELSGIVLSMFDEKGQPQDGFLRAHEIFNLNIPAELVVLSACQTGLGKEVKGEGLVGLTRGFMYAGAPRVVVSLWSVSDVGTAELMTRFYRGMLVEKLPPSKALQVAQIAMFTEKRFSSPFFWGAFTLQGEWRQSSPILTQAVDTAAVELAYWDTIKNTNDAGVFKAYLQKYPNGQFATLANNRIKSIEESANPTKPTPSRNADATELAFWESIKNSTNPEEFKLYIRKYPSGAFVELANARLARFEQDAKEAEEKDKILKELVNVEQEGFEAFKRGNKAAVAATLAEEFTVVTDGQSYNKEQFLSLIEPPKVPLSFSFEGLSLNLKGEIAVLDGIAVYRAQNATTWNLRQKFTDYFVKRNGRWLVLKSEVTTLR